MKVFWTGSIWTLCARSAKPKPEEPSAAPGEPSATPEKLGAASGEPSATPGEPGAAAEVPSSAPDAPTAVPDAPTAVPDVPTAVPDAPTTVPDAPTVAPAVPRVRVEIPRGVLESVFEECDRYDREETGGRMIGHYSEDGEQLVIRASGVIEAGPRARRSRTSFFQDGDHQTRVFRRLETRDPSIEHLGSWHTHHVNGYPRLSDGDKATYRRIVNHEKHNPDFFYALLVTDRRAGRSGLDRYAVRHYVLFRGDDTVHEIDPRNVRMTDQPRIWPTEHPDTARPRDEDGQEGRDAPASVAVRASDQVVLGVLFPSLEPRLSTATGTFFWRGPVSLIDGSAINVRVAEVSDEQALSYYPVVKPTSERVAELCETPFPSAAHAVRALESQMNREIFRAATTR